MGVPSEDRFRSPAELHLPPQDRPKPRISRKALHVQKPYNNKKRCVRKTKTLHRCVYTIEIERERDRKERRKAFKLLSAFTAMLLGLSRNIN